MKSKDYRELQLSSSHLVFIFVGILILGIVIFLLGVSVGKKQAQIIQESGISTETGIEQVKDKTILPAQESKNSISKELASHEKVKEEAQKQTTGEHKGNLYYIQVGAFYNKKSAYSFAEKFEKKGYPPLVLSPFPSDKKPVYRVRVGGFKTKIQAEELKKKLIQSRIKKKSDYFIVRK